MVKLLHVCFFAFIGCNLFAQNLTSPVSHIIIITTDGFRWQELFHGADSSLLFNPQYVNDTEQLSSMYWSSDVEDRRKKLMPFVWNYIRKYGQLWGNRIYDNKVSVSNPYHLSYAGYNEIFTGFADKRVIHNHKRMNSNATLLHFLDHTPQFRHSVAMFGSWELFKYIYKKDTSSFYVNSGYEASQSQQHTEIEELVNMIQSKSCYNQQATRSDMLTFTLASEYMHSNHPSIMHIAFGETDEYAHQGKYDNYLQQAHLFDSFLQQFWTMIQSDPIYKNTTTLFITTDHGRGKNNWTSHGPFVSGSNQSWLMQLGPNILPLGEMKEEASLHANQFAQTIASYLGTYYKDFHPVSDASSILLNRSTNNQLLSEK